jgi:hypothetical protein
MILQEAFTNIQRAGRLVAFRSQRRMNSYSSVYVESVKGWMDASEPRFVETVCKMEKEKQQCKWIGKA